MIRSFFIYILFIIIFSCEKLDETIMVNAEIIGFNLNKCNCCWGWIIKIDRDTIKSEYMPEDALYTTHFPVPVKIMVGSKSMDCSNFPEPYDYYKIDSLILR